VETRHSTGVNSRLSIIRINSRHLRATKNIHSTEDLDRTRGHAASVQKSKCTQHLQAARAAPKHEYGHHACKISANLPPVRSPVASHHKS
jgi:hypothetical protein